MLTRVAVLLSAAVMLAGASAQAAEKPRGDWYDEEYQPCSKAASTDETVECVAHFSGDQRDVLRAAQRLWVRYRDANCGFYAARAGTIRRIHAAECRRVLTMDRAEELRKSMLP